MAQLGLAGLGGAPPEEDDEATATAKKEMEALHISLLNNLTGGWPDARGRFRRVSPAAAVSALAASSTGLLWCCRCSLALPVASDPRTSLNHAAVSCRQLLPALVALMKKERWERAVQTTGDILKLQPKNGKALMRRAKVRLPLDCVSHLEALLRGASPVSGCSGPHHPD